ncbi:site-specific integrase [Aliikangiella sp. IMCC44359]|uniref:site-specific integrase n=1 Tax=Aliikangiella sp. IMCC44359 TaxID=3459125 RepID=UPI00403AD175
MHFYNLKHPKDIGAEDVTNFLTHLAVVRKVSPATQNQALCTLVLLYKKVLETPLCKTVSRPIQIKSISILRGQHSLISFRRHHRSKLGNRIRSSTCLNKWIRL